MARKDQMLTAAQRLRPRRDAARENGRLGGFRRAEYYDTEILSEWAANGGRAVLAKYGRDHFVELRKRRKNRRTDEITREERDAYEASMLATRLMSARRNGQKGGLARRALYGAQQRSEWARQGGIATRARYGKEYYREIRKKRKKYLKGYLTRKTKERLGETYRRIVSELAEDPHVASLGKFLAERQQASPRTLLGWSLLRALEHSLPPSDK
jgi:hypothetical protein